jgi:hypothetical protein
VTDVAPSGRRRRPDRFRLAAYGLTVECDRPLTGATPVQSGARLPDHPATEITMLSRDVFSAAWETAAERVFEPESSEGQPRFTFDRASRHYQLWLEGFGRYLVATDGSWIGCEQDGAPRDVQERFLFAQALPVAAVLHGREVLHAGAVCGRAGAAAFLGHSGSGKTTVTGHLVLRGARFLTDDVLALGTEGGDAVAYPGPPFMAIRPQDAWMVGDEQVGRAVGASDKIHVARRVPGGPVPLRVIYYLARGPDCRITPLDDAVRRVILGQAFVPYLATPQRLLRHLEIGQLVNERVAQFRLQTAQGGLDDTTLGLIDAHLRERGVL